MDPAVLSPALLHETHDLDSDDGKDAGHEVEDHPPQEHSAQNCEEGSEKLTGWADRRVPYSTSTR